MNKERIVLTDSTFEVIIKLCEGNPGAVSVCGQLFAKDAIDSDIINSGIMNLLLLDSIGIYGSEIWMLYKDVCKENITITIGMLRAHQLGWLSKSELFGAIRGITPMSSARQDDLMQEVGNFLLEFK